MKKSNAGRKKVPDAVRMQSLIPRYKLKEFKELVLKMQNEAINKLP